MQRNATFVAPLDGEAAAAASAAELVVLANQAAQDASSFYPVTEPQFCTTKEDSSVKCQMAFTGGDLTAAYAEGQPLYLAFQSTQLTQASNFSEGWRRCGAAGCRGRMVAAWATRLHAACRLCGALVPRLLLPGSLAAAPCTLFARPQLVFSVEYSDLGGLGPAKNWIALGILVAVLIAIASERIHRMWCAMIGAGFMVSRGLKRAGQ